MQLPRFLTQKVLLFMGIPHYANQVVNKIVNSCIENILFLPEGEGNNLGFSYLSSEIDQEILN